MRAITLSILITALLAISCSEKEQNKSEDSSLIGTWVQTERAYSIGGPLIVDKVTNGETYIIVDDGTAQLLSDNEFTGTWTSEGDALSFSFTVEEDKILDFTYQLDGDELILTPRFQICIEGCYNKYKRQ